MQLITSQLLGVKEAEVFPILDLPADMQRVVLGYVPLADLARLACLNKELRTAYVDRVMKRDTVVGALLQSHFPPEFRDGLSQTALPLDLVVHPQVWTSRFFYVVMVETNTPCGAPPDR
jgi:hypothetical protein